MEADKKSDVAEAISEQDEVQLLADEADVNEVATGDSETVKDEVTLPNGTDEPQAEKPEDTEEKTEESEEKTEEKTETIMEIDGKKVKKTTGGSKKSLSHRVSGREAMRRDRRKRAADMRRRTLLISNITLDDTLHEKLKNVIENCYHCQIRFLETKSGKRGIAECRFNTVEDATKAEGDLKEITVEDRTIEIRNLEEADAPSTWYEVGKELDKFVKDGSVKEDAEGGEKTEKEKEKEKDVDDELAALDELKTLVLLNLPVTTTEEMLQAIYSEAQKIHLPVDSEGQPKGLAYLEFETAELCTELLPKYEGISIEDDQGDRQIYIQTVKDYKKSKAKANARDRHGSRDRRSSRDPGSNRRLRLQGGRRTQLNRMRRGVYRSRGSFRNNRGRERFGQSSFRNRALDRKRDMQGGRRDAMNWGQNMMWNADVMNNMPNLLNMMGRMPASLMGINPFMGNTMNFQSSDASNRNVDDYNRNRKRKLSGEQDFYRGDNRRNAVNEAPWKTRRFENQGNYANTGGSYNDRDRGNLVRNRDRNADNRNFRRYY